ncbi:MAG: YIP1 family protein [Methanoculleaceae archaeon]
MINIYSLLFRPQEFFSGLQVPWSLRWPAVFVLLTGIFSGVAAIPVTRLTFDMLPADMEAYAGIGVAMAALTAVIMAPLIWLLIAGIMHGLSALSGGSGEFRQTLAAIGYGFVPMAAGTIISGVLMWRLVATAHVVRVADPMQIQAAINNLMEGPLAWASTAVLILSLLWAANIWVFGLSEARNLSTRKALICVWVPVVIYILLTLSRYIG